MTKLRAYLVIFITLFVARISRQATLRERVTYKNGMCHIGGRSYKHGEKIFLEPCAIMICKMENSSFGYAYGKGTSQPGTHFPKYKWRRELSYEALQKELLDLERRRKAEGTKHSFKDGTYDVHTDLSQDTPPRHSPAKVLRKRVPAAETKHRHREQPAGTDVSGTHSSESSDRDVVATKRKVRIAREQAPYPERSNRPKPAVGTGDSESYDIPEDRTRTIDDNEGDAEDNGKGMKSNFMTAPTFPGSTRKKERSHVRLAEQEPGLKSLWRKMLDATRVPAAVPQAPAESPLSVPALNNGGFAEANPAENTSSEDLPPEPNPDVFVPEDIESAPEESLDTPEKKDPDVEDKTSSSVVDHGANKIPPPANPDSPAKKDQVAAAAGAGNESPSPQPPPAPGAAAGSGFDDEDSEGTSDYSELMHGVCYYVWVSSSVMFVLFAVPLAALLLSHKGSDIPAHGLKDSGPVVISVSQQGCIDDAKSALVCTVYPVAPKNMSSPGWSSNEVAKSSGSTDISDKQTNIVRPVICVLNLGTQEMWERLKKNSVTWTYCAVLVLESLTVGSPKSQAMGRRGTLALERSTFNEIVSRTKHFVTRGKGTLPIYVTVGGERADSPAFASMIQDKGWKKYIVDTLDKLDKIIGGINLHWNHPGDNCDVNNAQSIEGIQWLVTKLKDAFTEVMLTVPASKGLVLHYGLTDSLLEQLSYVLVATHKLQRCDDTVNCGGARQFAASAFLRVRLDYDVRFWNKFAYSISARASVYLAKKIGSGSAGDGTPPEFRTKFSNKSQDILGLADVCHAKRAVASQDDECTLAILDDVKDSNGVTWHREPDIGAGIVMATPVVDVFATKTKQFNWTCVFRATKDQPIAAAEMSNAKDSYTLQLGISGDKKKPSLYKKPYAAIRDKYNWSKPSDHTLDVYDGKKGDYICLQTQFSVPQFDASNKVTSKNMLQFFFNGKQISVAQSFKADADLKDVLSRMSYHGSYFTNAECTEHHLVYNGIVEGLPQNASKEYISWRGIVLCYMSVGGSAAITGKYKAVKPKFSGVLLGIEKDVKGGPTQTDYHVFAEHHDPKQTLTFLLTVGLSVVHINSDQGPTWESKTLKPGNDFVWLVVQNFDIENVEIHTGINPRR